MSKKKIGLVARGLNVKAGGVKQYIKHLFHGLVEAGVADGHEVIVFYDDPSFLGTYATQGAKEIFVKGHKALRNPVTRFLWDNVTLPIAIKRQNIDVTLFPKSIIPVIPTSRSVATIHDLAYFLPGINAYTFHETVFTKLFLPPSARRSDAIIAVSKRTREDIYALFKGINPEKVKVIYEDAAFKPNDEQTSTKYVREKYGIGDSPYIFMSSELSPRKNVPRALKALAAIKDDIPHTFVMTGGKGWKVTNIADLVKDLGLEDRFLKIGYVEDDDMSAVYAEADVYFHPSVYEGFGLTLLEAMQADTPVCYSNVTSHPEVAGDAGLGFDPYNVRDIADKLKEICLNKDLQQELINKGNKQRQQFDWNKAAKQTLDLLLEVAA